MNVNYGILTGQLDIILIDTKQLDMIPKSTYHKTMLILRTVWERGAGFRKYSSWLLPGRHHFLIILWLTCLGMSRLAALFDEGEFCHVEVGDGSRPEVQLEALFEKKEGGRGFCWWSWCKDVEHHIVCFFVWLINSVASLRNSAVEYISTSQCIHMNAIWDGRLNLKHLYIFWHNVLYTRP